MNKVFKTQNKIKIFLLEIMPSIITLSILLSWCFYISFVNIKQLDFIFVMYFLTIPTIMYLYYKNKNNSMEILLEKEAIILNDFFNFKKNHILFDNIYEVIILVHRKKVISMKIFYIKNGEYLSRKIKLNNFLKSKNIVKLMRRKAQKNSFNLTEILIKKLGFICGERRIVNEINLEEYEEIDFNNKKRRFDFNKIIAGLLFLAFNVIFIISAWMIMNIFVSFIPIILFIVYYKLGYSIIDSLLRTSMTIIVVSILLFFLIEMSQLHPIIAP
ncbi:hypothetical protein [Sporohalobacter salinus]|uniref:hypothetical protein n=1 Tax=Sporohalobacter salinus TaxID=1494606 RepID=UPI001960E607|nr:hypothetical protein [Sporohalobacter salinus]MBM7623667.1 signal transduction histidine kinase [Sporohalobacter salinus]